MKKINCIFLSFTSLLAILINSCTDNPTSVIPPEFSTSPVITGIVITGEDSPDPLGVWGQPNEKGSSDYGLNKKQIDASVPGHYFLTSPYPNPTRNSFTLHFSLPYKSQVSLWIVKGVLPIEIENPEVYNNAILSPPSKSIVNKIDEGEKEAGVYSVTVSLNYLTGEDLSLTFYRVYLVINNNLLWRNVAKYDLAGTEEGDFFK